MTERVSESDNEIEQPSENKSRGELSDEQGEIEN